jgi:hypothetical protein
MNTESGKGAESARPAARSAPESDPPAVQRDPMTGINRDMPASPQEARGHPPGHTWGCTDKH